MFTRIIASDITKGMRLRTSGGSRTVTAVRTLAGQVHFDLGELGPVDGYYVVEPSRTLQVVA